MNRSNRFARVRRVHDAWTLQTAWVMACGAIPWAILDPECLRFMVLYAVLGAGFLCIGGPRAPVPARDARGLGGRVGGSVATGVDAFHVARRRDAQGLLRGSRVRRCGRSRPLPAVALRRRSAPRAGEQGRRRGERLDSGPPGVERPLHREGIPLMHPEGLVRAASAGSPRLESPHRVGDGVRRDPLGDPRAGPHAGHGRVRRPRRLVPLRGQASRNETAPTRGSGALLHVPGHLGGRSDSAPGVQRRMDHLVPLPPTIPHRPFRDGRVPQRGSAGRRHPAAVADGSRFAARPSP